MHLRRGLCNFAATRGGLGTSPRDSTPLRRPLAPAARPLDRGCWMRSLGVATPLRLQYSRFVSLSINAGSMYYCGGATPPVEAQTPAAVGVSTRLPALADGIDVGFNACCAAPSSHGSSPFRWCSPGPCVAGDHCPSPANFLSPYWATCAIAPRTAARSQMPHRRKNRTPSTRIAAYGRVLVSRFGRGGCA